MHMQYEWLLKLFHITCTVHLCERELTVAVFSREKVTREKGHRKEKLVESFCGVACHVLLVSGYIMHGLLSFVV